MTNTTNTTLSRTQLKLEQARARKKQIMQESEDARRLEKERTDKLRTLRLAREAAEETAAARQGAKK